MFKVAIIIVNVLIGISYSCLSQDLHNVVCDKYYEYEYEVIEGLNFEIPLDNSLVTDINLDIKFLQNENELEIAIDRISFAEELPITYSSRILEQAIIYLVTQAPWEVDPRDTYKWRIRVPACWEQIEDRMSELRGCVEVRECIMYSFDVIPNTKCDGISTYINFRQTEYSICDLLETGESCGSIHIDLKSAFSEIVNEVR